jgi:hypothetical protein
MADELIKAKISNDAPLTKTFYASLGRIAVEFAHLEDELRKLLARLMKSNRGLVIAAGETTTNLLAMCQRIAAFDTSLDDEAIETLTRLVTLVTLVADERNSALHAQWYPTDHPGHFCGLRSRRPKVRSPESLSTPLYWTVEMAEDLAGTIRTTRKFVEKFADGLPGPETRVIPWSRVTSRRLDDFMSGLSPRGTKAGGAAGGATAD